MISTKYNETNLHIGDTVRVRSNIVEGGKTRVQAFEGLLIAIKGRGENRTMTIRRVAPGGIGVERIWPLNATSIVDITVVKNPKKVRRAKLYFIRDIKGRMATRI